MVPGGVAAGGFIGQGLAGPLGAAVGGGIGGAAGVVAGGAGLDALLPGGEKTLTGDVDVSFSGRVAGMNLFAGSYIPGFGPVVQVAASHLMGDNPTFDSVRDIIAPFGDQRIKTPSDILDLTLPNWAQRFFSALGLQDPDQERLFGNTVMDVYKTLVLTQGAPTGPDQEQEYLDRAKGIAGKLTLYRSFAHFFSPTAPQIRFEAKDKNGEMWLFQSLATEYHRILFEEADGDDAEAFDRFTRRYGLEPTLFATPKTIAVSRRSVTTTGDQWARNNPGLFEDAPYTAYYAHPDDPLDESFEYNAYTRQLEDDARVGLTPEQWVMRRNDTLGRILYEKARKEIEEVAGVGPSEAKTNTLRTVRQFLTDRYRGYRVPLVGAPQTPSIEQKIRELNEEWPKHPELIGSEAGVALTTYLNTRRTLENRVVGRGLSPGALFTANSAFAERETLRVVAGELIKRYPDFQYLYRLVLEHEFGDDAELLRSRTSGGRNVAPELVGSG